MNQYVFLNERFIATENAGISFRDLAFQRGYGMFDFFRVYNGIALFLEDHLDRFYASAKNMHLPVKQSRNEMRSIIYELIQRNQINHSGIRITLTGGVSPDGYSIAEPTLVIAQQHFQPCTEEQFKKGIRLMSYEHQRQLAHVKTVDYLMAIHLQPKLKAIGADDILYYTNDLVRECPRANVFVVTKEDQIITPSQNILKGITRNKVLGLASKDFLIAEKEITINEILSSKEVFITSSTKEILPVMQIDEVVFRADNNVSQALHKQLQRLIQEYSLVTAE